MTTADEPKSPSPEQLLEQILDGLTLLRLPVMRQTLQEQLADPPDGDSRLAWLWRLLEPQVRNRIESRVERRIRESKLPRRKTFDVFDFDFQPELDKDRVLDLATLRFLDEGRNVLLAGMPGTGKSHIAMALALAACVDNRPVRYTTNADMLAALHASLADQTLTHALKAYVRPQLLVIDEVGLEQVESSNAKRAGLMQKVLLPRHNQRRSTIITSNIPWDAWGDYLEDHLGASALLDRLIHRSHIIVINGPSWRDHQHRKEAEDDRQPPVAT